MALTELKYEKGGRARNVIRNNKCSVCGIPLLESLLKNPVAWSRAGNKFGRKYYCNDCKEDKFSGVILR